MKILSIDQIRQADKETIARKNITSEELMEIASTRCAEWLASKFPRTTRLAIFCGPGNNGGDGLCIARIMHHQGYPVEVIIVAEGEKRSLDFISNLKKIEKLQINICQANDFAYQNEFADLIIDAIFGSGMKGSPAGAFKKAIEQINKSGITVISIDNPTGLPEYPERATDTDAVIKAKHTLCFQSPRLSFMFASNSRYTESFSVLDIGLDEQFIKDAACSQFFINDEIIKSILIDRNKFAYKNQFGHGLLLAGSKGKGGAALMAGRACLRAGAGLLTIGSADENYSAILAALPEAMFVSCGTEMISSLPSVKAFNAIAFGPGTGASKETADVLKSLIQTSSLALVLDADALNILSENKTWLSFLPASSILTPHPGEFLRFSEETKDDYVMLQNAIYFAAKHNIILVLKGAHTVVISSDGRLFFNSTGNPGLAKGGSGDTLTGILLALLCNGYHPLHAAIAGVFLHGRAADIALENSSEESLLASDVCESLPQAFASVKS